MNRKTIFGPFFININFIIFKLKIKMSDISSDKDLEIINDIIIPEIDNKIPKIELDKNLFIGPCFDFFKYKINEGDKNEIKDDEKNNNSSQKNTSFLDIDEREQIDEVKINMFFVLYNDADYNNEYDQIINQDQNFMLKRIVYQDYSINENIITFGKKNYIFIPIKSGKNSFEFIDENKNVIIVEKRKKSEEKVKDNKMKGTTMKINNIQIKNVDQFIQENSTIKNKEELKYKKCNESKSVENLKFEISEINNSLSENKNMTLTDINTISFTLSDSNKLSGTTNSKIRDDSEKELNGEIFYDNNKRYIYIDKYEKEIDGVFTKHKIIKLIADEIKLEDGLKALSEGEYNIDNDIQSHIIFKNFEDSKIKENEAFIIEVKKSMAELTDLLRQIKDITKIVNNLKCDIELPKTVIGIICSYNKEQVGFQMQQLNSKYKDGILLNHMINNIDNKINVVIGAIKDEKILNYNLGEEDFDNGYETRIDINFMNSLFKQLEENKMKNIFNKYSEKYESLTYKKYSKINYDILNDNYKNMLKNFKSVKKEKNTLQEKYKKSEKEKKEIEEDLNKAQKEKKEIEEDLNKAQKEKNDFQIKYQKSEEENKKLKEKIEELEKNLANYKKIDGDEKNDNQKNL